MNYTVFYETNGQRQYMNSQGQFAVSEKPYEWRSEQKARNAALAVKNELKDYMTMEEKDDTGKVVRCIPLGTKSAAFNEEKKGTMSDQDFNEMIQEIRKFAELYKKIPSMRMQLINQIREQDNAINDILHYIENNEVDAAESAQLVKAMHERRQLRRAAKDQLALITSLQADCGADNRFANTFGTLRSIESERQYSAKVIDSMAEEEKRYAENEKPAAVTPPVKTEKPETEESPAGEEMKLLRRRNGLTVKKIASVCRTSTASVQRFESGKLHPGSDLYKKLASYYARLSKAPNPLATGK